MKNFSYLLAWGTTALAVALGAWNWGTLLARPLLNLLQTRIDVSMGADMLALSALMAAALGYLHQNMGLLAQETQGAHDLTGESGSTHFECLRDLMCQGPHYLGQLSGANASRS